MNKRVHFIDNLRWMCVFWLIPYHAAMSYNIWGENFYIYYEPSKPIATVVLLCSPWLMPLMFLLAGVSARFSLKKRGYKGFIKERFIKLGIVFVLGVLLINPVLSYFADVTKNAYSDGYFNHYKVFFSRITDLTGYDGGFAIAHLWFILTLIIISLEACVIIKLVELVPLKNRNVLSSICFILLLLAAVATYKITIIGKPMHSYLIMFLLGYFFFGNENFIEKLKKLKWVIVPVFLIADVLNVYLYEYTEGYYRLNTICDYLAYVLGVIAIFCLGSLWFDFRNNVTAFFAKTSYVYYIIHFPIVVFFQYILDKNGMNHTVNFILTILFAFPVTLMLCFVYSRIKHNRLKGKR